MPIVEVDTLQRVRDMEYTHSFGTAYFRPGRITLINEDGQDYLVMASEGDGIGIATIGANGALDFTDAFGTSFDRLNNFDFGSNTIASIQLGDINYVYLSGAAREQDGNTVTYETGLFALRFDGNGVPSVIQHRDLDHPPQGYGTVSSFGSDPKIVDVNGRNILISSNDARSSSTNGTFETFEIRANGKLKPLNSTEPFVYDFEKSDVISVGNKTFVVGFGQFDIAPLQVLRLYKSGAMQQMFELPTSDTAIYNRVTTDLETVEIGGRSFVIVSESTSGTILVYEILQSGRLELVETERPGIGDSWGYPETLEVFEQNGNHYVAAGGYGSSIGFFQISSGGALIEVDEFRPATPLGRTYDLEARDIDGNQFIFSSSQAVDEVRSLRFVPLDESITGNNRDNKRFGTAEDDQIYGRGGNDVLKGFDGDDLIEGGNGRDRIVGGNGNDNLFGGARQDTLLGGDGDDFLFGDYGNDTLYGQDGKDYLNGGVGDDLVQGGNGNDRLFGASGNDVLKGGEGFDVLTDGAGFDQMIGGDGSDIFVFWQDGNRDVIKDYEDNVDRIDLTEFGRGLEFSDLSINQAGNNVRVNVMGEVIVIKSADGQIFDYELSLGDFIFA
ncbi:calcium-binding protein [Sedimentitalea sp.]|uniref:calcium-binding protein n=1 Tax=Sedimentitalea sp. TaxID=2048915 RepID=UPI00329981E9